MSRTRTHCPACTTGQAISTFTFAVFAVLLALASADTDQGLGRRAALMVCAALSALAVVRFPVARLLARHLQPSGNARSSHLTEAP